MVNRRIQGLCLWFMIWDVLLTAAAWIGAYFVRFSAGVFPIYAEVPDFSLCLQHVPLVMVFSAIAYRLTGQYEIHRLRRFSEEIVAVVKGTVLVSLLMMATTFYTRSHYESRASMILFSGLTFFFVLTARRLSWSVVRWLRSRGFNQTYAIIVGTGRVARATARHLRRATWLGIKSIGFVEDKPSRWCEDLDILGRSDDLPRLIEKYSVTHVFICLPFNRYQEVRHVIDVLSQTTAEIRIVADVPGLAGLSLAVSPLDNLTMINLRENPHYGLNSALKRAMDIVVSLVAIVLLSPVMIVIAILIKLTSRGPIFYAQERCSLNGKPFKMLKFRSMRVDAEKETGAVWAKPDDARRTPIGAFLRRTSLDELPQLFNVLKGEMSLVGPRPERPVFIQRFRKTIPNYMARHAVKCGITGWAQVHGWRGNTSLRKRIEYDLYYINHWSFWLDLRILWLTVRAAIFGQNAY